MTSTGEIGINGLLCAWLLAPHKSKLEERYAEVESSGVHFYSDENKQEKFGKILFKHTLDVTTTDLGKDKEEIDAGFETYNKVLAVWKKDRNVYYLVFAEDETRQRFIKAFKNAKEKPSSPKTLEIPSPKSNNGAFTDSDIKKKTLEFPIPGVILHHFTNRIYRELIKFNYVRRPHEDVDFDNVDDRCTNVFISPIGTYELLNIMWCGASTDSKTFTQLKHYLSKMPKYQELNMGSWEIDCQTQAKQLRLWLKRLTGHYQEEYDKTNEEEKKKKRNQQPKLHQNQWEQKTMEKTYNSMTKNRWMTTRH